MLSPEEFEIFHWTCPYCNRNATIGEQNYLQERIFFRGVTEVPLYKLIVEFVQCPHPKCHKLQLKVYLFKHLVVFGHKLQGEWLLCPQSNAKPQPEYIPEAIRDDYYEACAIRTLSPKASATLSRRCLESMISNCHGIKERNLKKSIDKLKDKIALELWEGINAVRIVGNIGAHMEKDVNLIVAVDPDEAGKLIGLIEILFAEWYVAKHNQEAHLKELKDLADKKDQELADAKAQAALPPSATPSS